MHEKEGYKFCLDTRNDKASPWIWPTLRFSHQSVYLKSESITSIGTFVAEVLLPCPFMMKVRPQSITSIGAFAAKVHLQRCLRDEGWACVRRYLKRPDTRCEGTIVVLVLL